MIQSPRYSIYDYIEIAEKLEMEEFQKHCEKIFKNFFYQALFLGNLIEQDCINILSNIDHILTPVPPLILTPLRLVKLDSVPQYFLMNHFNKEEPNSAINVYYQGNYFFYLFIFIYFYLFFFIIYLFLFIFIYFYLFLFIIFY